MFKIGQISQEVLKATAATMAKTDKPLTELQARFVKAYLGEAKGVASVAAQLAGSKSTSADSFRDAGKRLLKVPAVRAAIDESRAVIQREGELDALAMVEQLQADRDFARQNKNPMAAVKASELVAKIHGYMIDRVDQRNATSLKVEIIRLSDVDE